MYCDPPYLMETRSGRRLYEYEMLDVDHRRLLRAITEAALHGHDLRLLVIALCGDASRMAIDQLRGYDARGPYGNGMAVVQLSLARGTSRLSLPRSKLPGAGADQAQKAPMDRPVKAQYRHSSANRCFRRSPKPLESAIGPGTKVLWHPPTRPM